MKPYVRPEPLPNWSLLSPFKDGGHYADCYRVDLRKEVTLPAYIQAFYQSGPFRTERAILSVAVDKPSSDADVVALAAGRSEVFSAWEVEARKDGQILLADFQGQTRSWLALEHADRGTKLFFGSAVISQSSGQMPSSYSVLMGFHKLYSRILLTSAAKALSL